MTRRFTDKPHLKSKRAASASKRRGSKQSKKSRKSKNSVGAFHILLGLIIVLTVLFEPSKEAHSSIRGGSILEQSELESFRNSASENRNSDRLNENISAVENKVEISEEGPSDSTSALGFVGLDSKQLARVGRNIYRVANSMTDEFEIADGANIAMYVLRYMAEIGEFEMPQSDILKLVTTFESLIGEKVDEEVMAILGQIRKIKFGKRNGKYFSQFYSIQPARGIVIDINQVSDDPESSLKEIERFVMEEGSILFFEEIDTAAEKKSTREFIKTPIRLLGVLEVDSIRDTLYQVHSDIVEGIDDYLEWEDAPAPAMIVDMEGMYVTVDTSTAFKQLKFDFNQAYTFPGMTLDGDPAPSLVLKGKAKVLALQVLNLKVSIDQ